MGLSVGTIGHGSYYGSLAFIVECTSDDIIRTIENVNEAIATLKAIRSKYDTIKNVYIKCNETLKDNRLANIQELILGLRNEGLFIIGVCSPLAVQRWIDLVNYSVVSGHLDEYPVNLYRLFQEYLVDTSPEEGTITLPISGQKVLYNKDLIKSFPDALKAFKKGQVHNYGLFTYHVSKAGIK